MTQPTIVTEGLGKSFGTHTALEPLDWAVAPGAIVGVLGPNGAGKSTLAKLLLGITRPTVGSARVLGLDVSASPVEVRRRVAFVPEDKLLYDEMRVDAFLRFYGSYFRGWDRKAADALLGVWGIPASRKIRELSKGSRAKLALAAAVSRRPEILLLDEPTIDLDPASTEEVLGLLTGWVSEGARSVVLTTHRTDEVERICDTILILVAGRRLLEGNLDDLRVSWRRLHATGTAVDPALARGWAGVRRAESGDGWTTLLVAERADECARELRAAGAADVTVEGVGLREIYLASTDYRRGRLDDALESLV